MTKEEIFLANTILTNKETPLRIEVAEKDDLPYDEMLRDFRRVVELHEDKGLYIDDYYYIKSKDLNNYYSLKLSLMPAGEPVPTIEEVTEEYENLPWEEIIYVLLDKPGVSNFGI